MLILILILLLIIAGIILYQLYRLVRWILAKKTRIVRSVWMLSITIVGIVIYQLFFVKMEFIQSKVYPDLYLVKNPVEDRNEIDTAIKDFIIQNLAEAKEIDSTYTLRFYEYTKNRNPLAIFGDAGTAHFIENEEDPGGFTTEELSMYTKYKLATVEILNSTQNSPPDIGVIKYFKGWDVVKTDSIFINSKQNQ